VGEVAVGLKLARAILALKPDARFALTTTTTTGFAFAEKNASPQIEVLYSPLDFWPIMRRAFAVIQPERIILVEAGPRILAAFDPKLAARAMRDLEALGVQVWTSARVTNISAQGVTIGNEQIASSTVLWAAGVRAADVGRTLGVPLDQVGRVIIGDDLTIAGHPEAFVAGDLAHSNGADGKPLPGVALVAMQQGIYAAKMIRNDLAGKPRKAFRYRDLGQLATIGRSRAICEIFGLKLSGWIAWWVWLHVHIYRLSGFRNRIIVLIQWAWSYMTFTRGARLIVGKEWRSYGTSTPELPQ